MLCKKSTLIYLSFIIINIIMDKSDNIDAIIIIISTSGLSACLDYYKTKTWFFYYN